MQTDDDMFHDNSYTMNDISVCDIFSKMLNNSSVNIQFCKKYNLPSIYTVVAFLENLVITKLQKVLCVCNTELDSRPR